MNFILLLSWYIRGSVLYKISIADSERCRGIDSFYSDCWIGLGRKCAYLVDDNLEVGVQKLRYWAHS